MARRRSADTADDELLADLLATLDGDDAAYAFDPAEGGGDVCGVFPEALLGSLSDASQSLIGDLDDFGGIVGLEVAAEPPAACRPDTLTCSSVVSRGGDASVSAGLSDGPASPGEQGEKTDNITAAVGSLGARRPGGNGALKRRKDPNKARNERAREIRGLKGEVAELSAELKALKTLTTGETSGRLTSEEASNAVRGPLSTDLMGSPRVWEAICRNQLARRARAERENARLKRALDEQVKLAHNLERVLKKPSRAMRGTGDVDLCASKRVYSLPSDSDEDGNIFSQLLSEADAAYFEIDGILALNGLAGGQTEPIRGAQMRDGDHGRFLDMFSSNVLPFSLEATADVVWRFHSGTGKHRGPLYYKTAKTIETTQSTVIEKFAVELFSSTTRADFRFWQVIRRYVEADRVLVVWMALVEPVEVANNAFSSCAFRERGYTLCKREDHVAGDSASAFTRFQQCLRFEPYTTHAADLLSGQEKREIGAIIEFMLSQDSVRVYLETLEDELVRESLNVPKAAAAAATASAR